MDFLKRCILATICYYDAMDCPLSAFDVWHHLSLENLDVQEQYKKKQSLGAVLLVLDLLVRDDRLVCMDGFYVLPKRTFLCVHRRKKNRISAQKLYKMSQAIRFMRLVPFIRMVWATGRVAAKNAGEMSDWDVLIVLKSGHIWTGRFIATLMTSFFGRRRTDRHHADHICLNYWVTTSSMAISLDDRFSAHEYMRARVLFASVDPSRFLLANKWITRFLLHFDTEIIQSNHRIYDTKNSYRVRQFFEMIVGSRWLEHFLKQIQRRHIMKNPKTLQKNSMIIANDDELVFLPQPQSPRVLAAYHRRCRQEGLRLCV